MLKCLGLFSPLYAIQFSLLTVKVIRIRRKHRISMGDGEDRAKKAKEGGDTRAFEEISSLKAKTVPLVLILLGALELNGAPWKLIASLHTLFFLGRVFHANFGMLNGKSAAGVGRPLGMMSTMTTLLVAAFANFYLSLYGGSSGYL